MKQLPNGMKECVKIIVNNECPSEYGLEEYCNNGGNNCLTCWYLALKENEDKVYNQSKE